MKPAATLTTSSLLSIILIALFRIDPTSCSYRQKLVDYTASFIRFLQAQHPGYFQLWFYHAAPTIIPEDPILQEIHSALDTNPVPRMVLNTFDSSWIHSERQPIPLLIIHIESVLLEPSRWQNFTQMMIALDSHSKVLILTSFESPNIELEVLLVPFQYTKTFNVVYLSLDREFDCSGYDIQVIHDAAQYLNASIQYVALFCDGRECQLPEITKLSLDATQCPFDIYADQVSLRNKYQNHLVAAPISTNDVFLVPRGRSLNVVELFVKPFRPEVWILLLTGLILVKIASFILAGGFQNDVLLLPICGFERFDLNQANRTEKTVIFSLIVFFFFVSNAYESKFMSLMTNRPPAYEISTLEDILNMELTVKASKQRAEFLPGYKFRYIFAEDVNATEDRLDGVSVYLTNVMRAEVALLRPENWDFDSNQPRYKMLNQRLGLQLSFYLLTVRSLVKPALYHVQRMLFEGGILQLWYRQMVNVFYSGGVIFERTIPEEGLAPTAAILKFSDLLPLWNVLALGCCVSLVVFVVEVGTRLCTRMWNVEM
ncbi:hypothetical protein pipiens_007893 [Culex pipiens pipiens]|uniref:Ionotropic receptor n=1 Tax=Culex pipiens pipiens TaxID=38569 RepID=A0ABD1DJF6_CULPP